jgi:DNA-binding transcriptional LysR family regulator
MREAAAARRIAIVDWLGVEPRHLEGVVAVSREGSFRRAAQRLGLAQSALSERIAQLEQLLGARLVKRSRGRARVGLTEAGTTLVEHAADILAELDAAMADMRASTGATLRVGAREDVAAPLLAPAIGRLAEEAPDLGIDLVEADGLDGLVATGEIDVAVGELPLPPGPFAFRELAVDPWVLVVRQDSPLARRGSPPTLAELSSLRLLAPVHPLLAGLGEQLRGSHATLQALAARGVAAAVMPRLAVNENDPRVALVGLDGVLPPRRVVLYWHRDRRETAEIMRLLGALEARG